MSHILSCETLLLNVFSRFKSLKSVDAAPWRVFILPVSYNSGGISDPRGLKGSVSIDLKESRISILKSACIAERGSERGPESYLI